MISNVVQFHNISPEEFKNEILDGLQKKLDEMKSHLESNRSPTYLTRKEVSKMLKVSLVTINEWSKKGILQPMKIGSRIRFEKKNIEMILESSK
jgi:excisionase family DNA binding protein